jgi:hypothetical protein
MNKETVISKYMSDLGKKGRGSSKIRGNKGYYQHLVKIREAKRKSKAIEKAVKEKQNDKNSQV